MDNLHEMPLGIDHDDTLIDWFLSLEPVDRLAELESRLVFFNTARSNGDTKLPPDSGAA